MSGALRRGRHIIESGNLARPAALLGAVMLPANPYTRSASGEGPPKQTRGAWPAAAAPAPALRLGRSRRPLLAWRRESPQTHSEAATSGFVHAHVRSLSDCEET
ncbi:hypothetical protein C0Z19_21545 [Trinickia soli]|uniref:Uncharacterized protein n=1 Tax=Trinickia soli TaxID=380675 RepID=A0A2N7VQ15_9BURK|nr:hypothetical protein C0Z19_21545 [Trinickia soli]